MVCLYLGQEYWCESMGLLYISQDRVGVFGLAVSKSGYGCECMGWLNLSQNRSVMVWTVCTWVSMGV
jgi:hypothetical protein